MPSIKRKICSKHGIYEGKSCELCKSERNKSYDDTSRNQDSYKVYHSARWKRVRKHILKRDFGLCRVCGRGEKVMIVDHIQELKDRPDLAYSYENLETLCVGCHNTKSARVRAERVC